MKLSLLVVVALATGCGAPRLVAPPPATPMVGTATLQTAELTDAEEAPRVGKPQQPQQRQYDDSNGSSADDVPKGSSERRTDRRPGGGFSGYK